MFGCGKLRIESELDEREVVGEVVFATEGTDVAHEFVHSGGAGGRGTAHELDEFAPGPHRAVGEFDLVGAVAEEEELAVRLDLCRGGGEVEVGDGADHGA